MGRVLLPGLDLGFSNPKVFGMFGGCFWVWGGLRAVAVFLALLPPIALGCG